MSDGQARPSKMRAKHPLPASAVHTRARSKHSGASIKARWSIKASWVTIKAPAVPRIGGADACTLCDATSAYPLLHLASRSCTRCGAGTYRSGEPRCAPCDASCGECIGPGGNHCTARRPRREVTQEHTCRELCVADVAALPNMFALGDGD